MGRYQFSASAPRKMYWSDDVGGCSSCPDCGEALESEHHSYAMAAGRGRSFDLFAVGNRGGHFCGSCATIVLEREEFERMAFAAVPNARNVGYAVIGLVDLEAVPPDKRGIPFDDDTNPLPVVEFTGTEKSQGSASSRRKNRGRSKKRRGKGKR